MFWNMKFHLWLIMAVGAQVSAVHGQDRAMLRMGVISGFEEIANTTKDEDSKRSAEAMITVLFRELKTDFDPKDLDNYILVRVGDFIRTKTAHSLDALIYYEELLGREDHSYRFHALLGRADIYRQSPKAAEVDKAMEDYTEIYEKSEERPYREFALFRKIELLLKKKEYAKADEWARIYLDREKTGFTTHSAKVGLLFAESLDKQGMEEDAIAMYAKVWSIHMGNITVSAPAITRWMELLWARNNPGDRQAAYEKGAAFIELTSRFREKLTEDELVMWKRVKNLVQVYEADPEIKAIRGIEEIKKGK